MIYHADCIDILPSIPKVDLVLADMPYGSTNCRWDTPIDLDKLWSVLTHVCRHDTPILLFAQCPFDKVLGCSNIKNLRYEWIWQKSHPTGHLNAKKQPMKAHESVLVFYKKQPTYNPQKWDSGIRKTATKRADNTTVYGSQSFKELNYDTTMRYPLSVQKFASDKQRINLHPTQKPVEFLAYLIRTYTNKGDTVLDFCMGSGSTGVAASQQNRKFIGIEKDMAFFEIAKNRLRNPTERRINERD